MRKAHGLQKVEMSVRTMMLDVRKRIKPLRFPKAALFVIKNIFSVNESVLNINGHFPWPLWPISVVP